MIHHLYLALDGRDLSAALQSMWEAAPQSGTRWYRPAVCVWLCGKLARPFIFGPIQGLKGWIEAHEAAAASAREACGFEGPCVVSLESDPGTLGTLATAVEAGLIEALERGARERKCRLASVRPAWALACEPGERSPSADAELLCVCEADSMTVIAGAANQVHFAATYAPPPSNEDRNGLLQRLSVSVAIGARIEVADLGPDEHHGRPRLSWQGGIGERTA